MVLDYLETSEAYQVELIKKEGKIYVHITIDEARLKEYKEIHTIGSGVIGIDTNSDGFALTGLDNNLNYKESTYLKQHELLYARSNRRNNLCGELVKEVIDIAKENNWKQWSIISKKIKEKGGENPGLWQRNRKLILDIA